MTEISDQLQDVFREVFGDPSIVLDDAMTAEDVDGWDSLTHINLIIAISKRFGIKFATAEISRTQGRQCGRRHFARGRRRKASIFEMSLASLQFLLALLILAATFFYLPGVRCKQVALAGCNFGFLYFLIPKSCELAHAGSLRFEWLSRSPAAA